MSADGKKVVDLKGVRGKVQARTNKEREKFSSGGGDTPLSSKFVLECLNANEFGDGLLFCALHKGKLVYNASGKEWLRWVGHHWKLDILDSARAGVEAVAQRFLGELVPLAKEIQQALSDGNNSKYKELVAVQAAIRTRVNRLRSDRGRKNCLQFVMTSTEHLAVEGDVFDQNPWLFPCANGVIDLKTGMLLDGRPEDFMIKASPVEFLGIEEPCERWEHFLLEIYEDNRELVDFIQRLLGYYLTGLCIPAVFPVFHGPGRNGKGTVAKIMQAVLGPLAAPIPAEMFLDQGKMSAKNPDAPTSSIMALRGLRLAVGSETDDGRRVSAGRIKWLTGNDTLVGRNPNEKYQTSFEPTHKLLLLTNHKPQAPGNDFAFWERCLLIPHRLKYVFRKPATPDERRADPELENQLKSILPGILGWLVKGCLKFQSEGLNPPAIVTEATAKYQSDEDFIGKFIGDCCVVAKHEKVNATDLYEAFEEWWLENENKKKDSVPSQKRFGKWIGERFEKKKDGNYKYFGIRLMTEGEKADLERSGQ